MTCIFSYKVGKWDHKWSLKIHMFSLDVIWAEDISALMSTLVWFVNYICWHKVTYNRTTTSNLMDCFKSTYWLITSSVETIWATTQTLLRLFSNSLRCFHVSFNDGAESLTWLIAQLSTFSLLFTTINESIHNELWDLGSGSVTAGLTETTLVKVNEGRWRGRPAAHS